ncbi:helix-turn-helix domain-containing protein [Paenibacillus sp. strain BS8-2]
MRLQADKLEEAQKEKGWNESEMARRMGISRSRLWRAKLDVSHPSYCSPGPTLIAGVLKAFPEKGFTHFFDRNV